MADQSWNRIIKTVDDKEKELQEEEARMKAQGAYKGYRYVDLPKEEWHTCNICHGKGSYLESEDAHRSEGWVPCSHCINGTVKRKYIREWCWPKRPYYG